MSLSADPVETLLVDDPRIDFDDYAAYLLERGAGDIVYRSYQANNRSNNSVSFETTVPSRDTVVSPKVHVRIPVTINITGNNLGNAIEPSVAPRFHPILQACQNLRITLNGKTFTEDLNKYFTALMHYNSPTDNFLADWSTSPSQMDMVGQYYKPDNFPITYGNGNTQLPNDAGLGAPFVDDISDMPIRNIKSRRTWNLYSRDSSGNVAFNDNGTPNTNITFNYVFDEILPISPLYWGHKEVKGLIGLDTFNIYLGFASNLGDRLISSSRYGLTNAVPPVDSNLTITPTIGGDCFAEFIYLTPKQNVEIPRTVRYPYSDIISYVDNGVSKKFLPDSTAPAGRSYGSTNNEGVTIGNKQLQGVPKRVYIFATYKDSNKNYHRADCFARITNISLNIGNRSGILAEASEQELYRISVKNGLRDSWVDWQRGVGSVLCLDFAQDIPLSLTDVPGTLKQLQLYYTLTYQKINSDAIVVGVDPAADVVLEEEELAFDVHTVIVYDGMLIIKDGLVLPEINDVASIDVVDSMQVRRIPYDMLQIYTMGGSYSGGNLDKFIGKTKSALGKAKKFVQDKIIPGAEKALPYAKKGLELAEAAIPALMALGYTEDQIYKLLKQKGGAVMSKKSIKQRFG